MLRIRSNTQRLGRLLATLTAPEDDVATPPILLIHGLGGGTWGWEPFQTYFAQRGYRTFAVELPGHGADCATTDCATYSVETYALHVAACLPELGPCIVVGHSMGGLVAQKLAETHPQRGYVFLASAPPWHMFRRAYRPMWRHLLRHPWREVLAPSLGRPLLLDHTLQDHLVNNRLPESLRGAVYLKDVPDSGRASFQMVLGLVSVDRARISSPCLVVGGADDRLIPAEEQRRLADFYQCPLQLHDAAHMLMLEDGWSRVADGILGWVAGLVPAEAAEPVAEAVPAPVKAGKLQLCERELAS